MRSIARDKIKLEDGLSVVSDVGSDGTAETRIEYPEGVSDAEKAAKRNKYSRVLAAQETAAKNASKSALPEGAAFLAILPMLAKAFRGQTLSAAELSDFDQICSLVGLKPPAPAPKPKAKAPKPEPKE